MPSALGSPVFPGKREGLHVDPWQHMSEGEKDDTSLPLLLKMRHGALSRLSYFV